MNDDPNFLNRDLSWLEFNQRVLHEALDERTPLLERVKFLGIFTSNLDEFYMKRVGALMRQSQVATGTTPLLQEIRRKVRSMLAQQAQCFTEVIRPALAKNRIHLVPWQELGQKQRQLAEGYFRLKVFPVLTPLAVDPGHPFPLVSNLSTSLAVLLQSPDQPENPLFARVKIPGSLPQWINVEKEAPNGEVRFTSLLELIGHNLQHLFPGMEVVDVMPFRVTRNAEIERDEEDAEDLIEMITDELRERRFARIVRLEIGPKPNTRLLQFLVDELELTSDDVYELPSELDFTSLRPIGDLARPSLKFEPWMPVSPPALATRDGGILGTIRASDLLVHHPYESFNATVLEFIATAVADPRVLAIKMTLYRTGGDDSPFVPLLIRAAEAGKEVVCLVELKARFDEERNIAVARLLEKAGVHVVYGVVGLKTHCKLALVVREDPEGVRGYVHVGTGNYHAKTAHLYTDLGLFTAKPAIVDDAIHLFNYLTGRSLHRNYQKLLVAPSRMKDAFLERIAREAEHAKAGRPARIVAKMNSLEDREIIRALYAASQAGVPVDLVVRGFATLRPGVPGLSEHIRVLSIIGRFLEHSRIFHFSNGKADPLAGEYFLGSGDWMHRNLHLRVEAGVPIEDRSLRERLWEIFTIMLADRRQAWEMKSDGSYVQRTVLDPAKDLGTHQLLMNLTRQRAQGKSPA